MRLSEQGIAEELGRLLHILGVGSAGQVNEFLERYDRTWYSSERQDTMISFESIFMRAWRGFYTVSEQFGSKGMEGLGMNGRGEREMCIICMYDLDIGDGMDELGKGREWGKEGMVMG